MEVFVNCFAALCNSVATDGTSKLGSAPAMPAPEPSVEVSQRLAEKLAEKTSEVETLKSAMITLAKDNQRVQNLEDEVKSLLYQLNEQCKAITQLHATVAECNQAIKRKEKQLASRDRKVEKYQKRAAAADARADAAEARAQQQEQAAEAAHVASREACARYEAAAADFNATAPMQELLALRAKHEELVASAATTAAAHTAELAAAVSASAGLTAQLESARTALRTAEASASSAAQESEKKYAALCEVKRRTAAELDTATALLRDMDRTHTRMLAAVAAKIDAEEKASQRLSYAAELEGCCLSMLSVVKEAGQGRGLLRMEEGDVVDGAVVGQVRRVLCQVSHAVQVIQKCGPHVRGVSNDGTVAQDQKA